MKAEPIGVGPAAGPQQAVWGACGEGRAQLCKGAEAGDGRGSEGQEQ